MAKTLTGYDALVYVKMSLQTHLKQCCMTHDINMHKTFIFISHVMIMKVSCQSHAHPFK